MNRSCLGIVCAACLALTLAGCGDGEPSTEKLSTEAKAAYEAEQFAQAVPLFKRVLCDAPGDMHARYYLASCYERLGWATLARGEFITTLTRFNAQGRTAPPDGYTADEFEALCYLGIAKASFHDIETRIKWRIPLKELRGMFEQVKEYLKKAASLAPKLTQVTEFESIVKDF